MASRGSGGSRYPSAYGHTPSYRSYNSLHGASSGIDTSFPSTSSFSSTLKSDLGRDRVFDDKFFDSALDRTFDRTFDTSLPSTYGSNLSSSKKVESSSYKTSKYSSDSDRARPVVEYSNDSTYRSTNAGSSGVPHHSYSHNSSSYSSENPYKNRVSSYSYNI